MLAQAHALKVDRQYHCAQCSWCFVFCFMRICFVFFFFFPSTFVRSAMLALERLTGPPSEAIGRLPTIGSIGTREPNTFVLIRLAHFLPSIQMKYLSIIFRVKPNWIMADRSKIIVFLFCAMYVCKRYWTHFSHSSLPLAWRPKQMRTGLYKNLLKTFWFDSLCI